MINREDYEIPSVILGGIILLTLKISYSITKGDKIELLEFKGSGCVS